MQFETGLGSPAPHPGTILKQDVLPETGLTVAEFAERLGVRPAGISDLLEGQKPLTLDMAVRLGMALGTGARFWLSLQLQYDLATEVPRKEKGLQVDRLAIGGTAAA